MISASSSNKIFFESNNITLPSVNYPCEGDLLGVNETGGKDS